MKKKYFFYLLLIMLISVAAFGLKGKAVTKYPFYVFFSYKSALNHFSPSGWMGDFGDINIKSNIKKNAKVGTTCLRVKYSGESKQGKGWGGIYWQNPAGNWGNKKGGFNLSKAKSITFYARGRKGGEIVEFKLGGINGKYSDSDQQSTGQIKLQKYWTKYSMDLVDIDLNYINGGFCVVFTKKENPTGCVFYIDDIRYNK